MKVFFTASQRGKKFFDKYYLQIFNTITREGYTNLCDALIKIPIDKFYEDLEKSGHAGYAKLYDQNIKTLQTADINVFECSLHSLSIGFMVQKSLDFHKPTIVLFLKDHTPFFLAGLKDEKLIMKEYDDANLEKVLIKCLEDAKNLRDKRFNFFLNDEMLRYIEEASKREGVNKSTFLRNLVLSHQKKSKKQIEKII